MTWTRRDFMHAALVIPAWASIATTPPRRVRTIAGASQTPVANPYGITPGPDGGLYFCEVDSGLIRRLDLRTGAITPVAGTGVKGYSGDGGPAAQAAFSAPHEIRFDGSGNLYIVERDSHVVRRVDARTNVITTMAGTGTPGFAGDGGPAAKAQLNRPHSIAFDASGDLLICDIGNHRVRAVSMKAGTIRTFAGTGAPARTPDDAPITGTPLNGPRSIDTDPTGDLYLVLREGNALFRLDARANRLTRIAGTGEKGFLGDKGPARQATFNGPKGIACADRNLYIADTENHAIRRVDERTGRIETVLGTGQKGNGPDGDPLQCGLNRPHGLCFHRGVLYVTDSENNRILAVS
jgi:DNA-binding beta-propeller fold protein YncE